MSTLIVDMYKENHSKQYSYSQLELEFAFGVCLVPIPNVKFANNVMFAFSVHYIKSKI